MRFPGSKLVEITIVTALCVAELCDCIPLAEEGAGPEPAVEQQHTEVEGGAGQLVADALHTTGQGGSLETAHLPGHHLHQVDAVRQAGRDLNTTAVIQMNLHL